MISFGVPIRMEAPRLEIRLAALWQQCHGICYESSCYSHGIMEKILDIGKMEGKFPVDRLDVKILNELQRDSRQPIADIAERAGLSLSACHRRIKILESTGIIEGYGARLDAKALGLEIEVFAEISLFSQHHSALEEFEQAVLSHDEILECKLTTGASDYILRIIAKDVADYDRIHRNVLSDLPGVASMRSIFALRSIKDWQGLPVRSEDERPV
ncbi:MAG: Lrp/AsnC family transcriptional regulator [Pseudomonadota bacterium]